MHQWPDDWKDRIMGGLRLTFDESYCDGPELQGLANRLYATRALIAQGFEEIFRRRALYANAHSTVAIEGNPLSAEEALRVSVEGADPERPDEVEVANIEAAYELIYQIGPDPSVAVDQGLIRTLHSIVLKGLPGREAASRGRYRLGAAGVVRAGGRELVYLPPPPETVPELMAGVVEDIAGWRERYPPAVTAALAHFALVSVHPFEDGNGRTARLVSHMLLSGAGDVAPLLTVNDAIWARREAYYRVLRETQGRDFRAELDVTPFLAFHTEALTAAAVSLEDEAVEFAQVRDRALQSMKGVLSERQGVGLMYVMAFDRGISSSTYSEITGASSATASRDLSDLVSRGLFERAGRGKGTRYVLSDSLTALRQAVLRGEDPDQG